MLALPMPNSLKRLTLYTKTLISFETAWQGVLTLLCLIGLFFSCVWLGLFDKLLLIPHILALAFFIVSIGFVIYHFFKLPKVSEPQAFRRIEAENQLKHTPLTHLSDKNVNAGEGAFAFWALSQAKAKMLIEGLKKPVLNLNTPVKDPFAFRALVALLFTFAFFVGGDTKISSIFEFDKSPPTNWRADMWITPPDYTGLPSQIIVTERPDSVLKKYDETAIKVPMGTKLHHRFEGLKAAKLETALKQVENLVELTEKGSVILKNIPKHKTLTFTFDPQKDLSPTVSFIGFPKAFEKNQLEVNFKAGDDYGVASADGVVTLTEATKKRLSRNPRPLYDLPKLALPLPPRGKEAELSVSSDLSASPFAGLDVHLTLQVKDDLGQEGKSETLLVYLPAKTYTKPLARAVIEQRQTLALDMNLKNHVLSSLEVMMLAPQLFMPQTTHYLALRTAYSRLQRSWRKEQFESVADYLLEIANAIEDANTSDLERQVRNAQQALNEAMQRNAPQDEISRLMQQLREAMNKMMQEMAKQLQNQPPQQGQSPPQNRQSQQQMQDMLAQIEKLMREGAHEQAKRLLEQLQAQMQELMQAMREGRLQMEQNPQQDSLSQLNEMMRKQQELRDKTFQDKDLDQLGKEQEDLKKQLEGMQKEGMGKEAQEGLGEAEREMGNAERQLKEGNGKGAMESQRKAMEGMQKGASQLAQQQRGRGEGQGNGEPNNPNGQPLGERGNDPLGRQTGRERGQQNESAAGDGGKGNALQGPSTGERAGKILEELRKRAGDINRPQEERDYIERLLKGLK